LSHTEEVYKNRQAKIRYQANNIRCREAATGCLLMRQHYLDERSYKREIVIIER